MTIAKNNGWLICMMGQLGLSEPDIKELGGVSGSKTVRRWRSGESRVPEDVIEALELLRDDQDVLADAAVAAWEDAGQPRQVALVVYTDLGVGGSSSGNDLLREWGQPMPARGCADGSFAGLHRLAMLDAADEMARRGADVTLVRFYPDSYHRWLVADGRQHGEALGPAARAG